MNDSILVLPVVTVHFAITNELNVTPRYDTGSPNGLLNPKLQVRDNLKQVLLLLNVK